MTARKAYVSTVGDLLVHGRDELEAVAVHRRHYPPSFEGEVGVRCTKWRMTWTAESLRPRDALQRSPR